MARGLCLAAIPVLSLSAALPALAFDSESFRSPSGNIACTAFSDESGVDLRCDVGETSNPQPERPADCELDWGSAFQMSEASTKAERICHGDTVLDPGAPVLSYGLNWRLGGFVCTSSESGMSCRNAHGAGWDLSRSSQQLF